MGASNSRQLDHIDTEDLSPTNATSSSEGLLFFLPLELWGLVFNWIPTSSLQQVMRFVCKSWNQVWSSVSMSRLSETRSTKLPPLKSMFLSETRMNVSSIEICPWRECSKLFPGITLPNHTSLTAYMNKPPKIKQASNSHSLSIYASDSENNGSLSNLLGFSSKSIPSKLMSHVPNLRVLMLKDVALDKKSWNSIRASKLEVLFLDCVNFDNLGFNNLNFCTTLRKLRMNLNSTPKDGTLYINPPDALKELAIHFLRREPGSKYIGINITASSCKFLKDIRIDRHPEFQGHVHFNSPNPSYCGPKLPVEILTWNVSPSSGCYNGFTDKELLSFKKICLPTAKFAIETPESIVVLDKTKCPNADFFYDDQPISETTMTEKMV